MPQQGIVYRDAIALQKEHFQEALKRVEQYCGSNSTSLDLSGLVSLRHVPNLTKIKASIRAIKLKSCQSLSNFSFLADLVGLEYLDLGYCSQLNNLDELINLAKLQHLDLSGCEQLNNLDGLNSLGKIRYLNLSSCQKLTHLDSLANLSLLQHLDLNRCKQITKVDVLAKLNLITYLNLSLCERLECINGIRSLVYLEHLDLSSCQQLTRVDCLQNLTALRHLNFGMCDLLSEIDGLSNLVELQQLDLSGCKQLNKVLQLENLVALQRLDLSGCNQLSSLKGLEKLTALEHLDLSGCQKLSSIAGLEKLTGLEHLDLNECLSLCNIGPIADLSNLKTLHLYGLLSSTIEKSAAIIIKCVAFNTQLEELFLSYFPGAPYAALSKDPFSGDCLQEFRAWWKDCTDHKTTSGIAVKLLVIGNAGAGKTDIIRRLASKSINNSKRNNSIHIHSFKFRLNYEMVTINACDFGGQDIYHGTYALFAAKRALYLIIWDPETDKSYVDHNSALRHYPLSYWIDFVRASPDGSDSAVVLVQSKCDKAEYERPIIPGDHGLKHLKMSHCGVSRMEELTALLKGAIKGLLEGESKIQIPKSWDRVRARIARINKQRTKDEQERSNRTMSQTQFEEYCSKEKCANAGTVRDHLYSTGVFFFRAGLFDNQIILDQSWALNAIYAIFHQKNSQSIVRQYGGKFSLLLLRTLVWRDRHFSSDDEMLLLSMMEQCFICFRDQSRSTSQINDETIFFAPDLMKAKEELPNGQIDSVWDKADPSILGFDAEFDFLHDGIIRKLLCNIGAKAGAGAHIWRYGCTFLDGKTQARALINTMIESDSTTRGTIEIRTQGENSAQLLTVLHHALENVAFGTRYTISNLNIASSNSTRHIKADRNRSWTEFIEPSQDIIQPTESGLQEHFSLNDIMDIQKHAIDAGLGSKRWALLVGIPEKFVASLRTCEVPADQIFMDLVQMNQTHTIDDAVPLKTWLHNAVQQTDSRPRLKSFFLGMEQKLMSK